MSSPANTEINALPDCDKASELPPVCDLLYVAESHSPRGDEAAEAIPALPLCITVVPSAEDMAARCASNKASAYLAAIAATAFLVNALQGNAQVARGAAAAAISARSRAVCENARVRGETNAARRRDALSWFCCFAPPVGFHDTRLLNAIVRATPFGATADVLLAHCLSTHTIPGIPSRNVLLLTAGALAYISVPETCAAAFARAAGALVADVMEHPKLYRAKGEAGANACVGLVQVLRVVLSRFADDAMMCGSALEALALLTTCVHVDRLWNTHFQFGLSMRLGALAADAMLQHAPFMAVQAAGTKMLAQLLVANGGAVASTGQLSTNAVLSKGNAEWVRDGTLARASTALLFALRGAAVAAAKAERQGWPMPPHAERILSCAPAALASALRIVCADDAVDSGSRRRLEATQNVLRAVLDVCSSLEAVSSDEVVATADAVLLPALTELLSSRMWWEQSGAAGCINAPESTAQLLTAVANAKERADRRNAIAAARSAPLTAAPLESAPLHKAPPFGRVDDHTSTRDLIDSLLAAQDVMAARLHAMEDGMARTSGI